MSEVIGLNDNKLLRSDYVYDANKGARLSELNDDRYVCCVCYNGNGETSFSGEVKFNHIIWNDNNCYSTSTGRYTCPVGGIYIVSFGYFSNNNAFNANNRPTIYKNGSMYATTSVNPTTMTLIIPCDKGATISAGCYTGSISFYAWEGHNWFNVALLRRY